MRVLMVTPWFPIPDLEGSGIFVLRDALAVSGDHDVSVVHLDSGVNASDRQGAATVSGIPVLRIPFNRWRVRGWFSTLRAVRAAAESADVVHTHALTGIVLFALGRPARGTRWVHTEHWSGLTSPETLTPRGRISRRFMMTLLKRPDAVIVACERLARTIGTVRRAGTVNVPCVVVPPAAIVDAPADPDLFRMVGVGGMIERKGALCALDTVAELANRGINAELTWVGNGEQRDEMVARAAELGLSQNLRLTGSLDEAGVGRELDRADLFILPTLGDNFCIVVAEALSHGRPVVSGADTGAVDYSDPAVSRFIDDARNPVAYADAVLELRAQSPTMSSHDIAATVNNQFTPERVSQLLTAVYQG